jgi:protein O-GlcNAc transferase
MPPLFEQAVRAHQGGRFSEAEDLYRKIISDEPKHFDALHMLGVICSGNGKAQDADKFFRAALSIDSGFPPCHVNYGFFLLKQKRLDDAVASFDRALLLFPNFAEALSGRGNALRDLKRYDDAFAAYDRAIQIKPGLAEAHAGRANLFAGLERYAEAIAAYDKALDLKPDLEFVASERLHCKMQLCDWNNIGDERQRLIASVRNKKAQSQPFHYLNFSSSAQEQLECARSWNANKVLSSGQLVLGQEKYKHDRIRIAYVSADFREHAVTYLVLGLFKNHRKEDFEVVGISLQPEDPSPLGQQIKSAFEKFIDVSKMSDQKTAQLIRDMEIDIVIDLTGFTKYSRADILARRPAPIQINYLGFPGTMGAAYMDYIIGDKIVIPDDQRNFYSEKIVYMPSSFQANDQSRPISEKTITREQLELPQQAFVFCCFNNNYKLTPDIFDIWMRILGRVDGSVLWLVASGANVQSNLRKEATARGVDAGRIVFAPRLPYAEHLARLSAANLFLDTLPYNAGATASDALWAQLPVLTRAGDTFVGRMAASLLQSVGLPELVTATPQAYEDVAVEIATHPEKYASIKDKLARARLTGPLFDTLRFTRHMEAAYTAIYRRYQEGLPPDHIHVPE